MTTPTISLTPPKGCRLNINSATPIAEINDENIPDWAMDAMTQGKQVVRRNGEWFLATYETEEEKKEFATNIQIVIKGHDDHRDLDTYATYSTHAGGATEFHFHLADGTTINNEADLPRFSARMRANLREATQEALVGRNGWNLNWDNMEIAAGGEADLADGRQMNKYAEDAIDFDFYKNGEWDDDAKPLRPKGVIYILIWEWLKEQGQKKTIDFGKYGGDWNCGENSGVWADFLLTVKSKPSFKGHQPIKGEFYIGVRLHATSVLKPTLQLPFTERWRPTFTIVATTIRYEPQEFGLTTVMMPNFGKPFTPTKVKQREREMKAEVRERREREKAIAHQEFLDEQRRLQAELKAKREADEMETTLAETIKAYNERATKDLITFNRTHIAEPLRKRVEAKEAEIARLDAERRHAEKLKQKELERLAKHAPSFKTKSK